MKRIITIIMVTALVGGAAFARGNDENANSTRQGNRMQNSSQNGEVVSYSGTVEEIDGQVVLKSSEGIFSLSAPGFYRAGVEIPYGETIEVMGSESDPLSDCDIDADGHIFVSTAMVNGEELSFTNGRSETAMGNGKQDSGRGNDRSNDDRSNAGRNNTSRSNASRSSNGRGNSDRGGSDRGGSDRGNSDRGNRSESGQGGRWNSTED